MKIPSEGTVLTYLQSADLEDGRGEIHRSELSSLRQTKEDLNERGFDHKSKPRFFFLVEVALSPRSRKLRTQFHGYGIGSRLTSQDGHPDELLE